MTTTIKHREFCKEDMKDKTVQKLPGIGAVLGAKLTENGYPLARDVYSQLKTFDFDKTKFQEWLKVSCGGNLKQSSDCYEGLKEWHEQFGKNNTSSSSTNSESGNQANTSTKVCKTCKK